MLRVKQFVKAQTTAIVATGVDFLLTLAVFTLLPLQYLTATLIGAIGGGVVNCVVNYRWTFCVQGLSKYSVAWRYIVVWVISILFNIWGTYYLTELLRHTAFLWRGLAWLGEYRFMTAKALTAVWVAVFWNYNMQARFVYRARSNQRVS